MARSLSNALQGYKTHILVLTLVVAQTYLDMQDPEFDWDMAIQNAKLFFISTGKSALENWAGRIFA